MGVTQNLATNKICTAALKTKPYLAIIGPTLVVFEFDWSTNILIRWESMQAHTNPTNKIKFRTVVLKSLPYLAYGWPTSVFFELDCSILKNIKRESMQACQTNWQLLKNIHSSCSNKNHNMPLKGLIGSF